MRLALAIGWLVLLSAAARADWQVRSWSEWHLDERGATVVFGIERAELARLGFTDDGAALRARLPRLLQLHDGGAACAASGVVPVSAGTTRVTFRMRLDCAQPLHLPQLRVEPLVGWGAPLHYASVVRGRERQGFLFTRDLSRQTLATAPQAAGAGQVFIVYLRHGIEHILVGFDHVAFLICMLLAARPLAQRLWMVTGFTLGHSVTLSLSALGLLRVQTAAVEALIGFTVALLAAEVFQRAQRSAVAGVLLVAVIGGVALSAGGQRLPGTTQAALLVLTPAYLLLAARARDPARLHLGMTAVIGLVHGLGFAAVLQVLGLPQQQRGWALAGFNVGVEIGQVAVLLGFAALLALLRRAAGQPRALLVEQGLAACLCALGVFWFVERLIPGYR